MILARKTNPRKELGSCDMGSLPRPRLAHARLRTFPRKQFLNSSRAAKRFHRTDVPSFSSTTAIMSHLNKIAPNSPSRQSPSEIETSIATALYELENNIQDMRASLRPLQFVSAREVSSSAT
jgi:hypothetical protein